MHIVMYVTGSVSNVDAGNPRSFIQCIQTRTPYKECVMPYRHKRVKDKYIQWLYKGGLTVQAITLLHRQREGRKGTRSEKSHARLARNRLLPRYFLQAFF